MFAPKSERLRTSLLIFDLIKLVIFVGQELNYKEIKFPVSLGFLEKCSKILRKIYSMRTYKAKKLVLPRFTLGEFKSYISAGMKWMLVGDRIINAHRFINSHPGGAGLIHATVGQDISKFIYGIIPLNNQYLKYPHSTKALKLIKRLTIGGISNKLARSLILIPFRHLKILALKPTPGLLCRRAAVSKLQIAEKTTISKRNIRAIDEQILMINTSQLRSDGS
jgi:hypothetical protein